MRVTSLQEHERVAPLEPGTEPLLFPSSEWFEALASVARSQPERYRRLGATEIRIGIDVGDSGWRVVFDDYEVTEVAVRHPAMAVDCTLSASPEDWRELVEHIRERGSADPTHTLNSLVLSGTRFTLSGEDQLGVDRFYRFNATLQAFIDGAKDVPTRFA